MYERAVACRRTTRRPSVVPQGRRPGRRGGEYNLGSCTSNGQGVAQDYAQALDWFRKAADQGNADAQCNLGSMYATATASRRTTRRPLRGSARPPTRATPLHRSPWLDVRATAKAWHRTTRRP